MEASTTLNGADKDAAFSERAGASSTLYLGNLHPLCTSKNLEELCRMYGDVLEVKIPKDKATGVGAGFGFARYDCRNSALNALKGLNGRMFLGQQLRVHRAFQSPHGREDTSSHHHIFVGDLGQEVNDGLLYSHACQVGDCSDARVMWDHATGRSKGYGFISFRTREDAEKAVAQLNGAVVGSKRVRCGWAQHKEDGGPPADFSTIDKMDPYNSNVYIGNTPPCWSEHDLIKHFSSFGEVVEGKLHKKGSYGFVKYAQHYEAVKAIVETHGSTIEGKVVKCSWGKAPAGSTLSSSGSGMGVDMSMLFLPGITHMGMLPHGHPATHTLVHPSLFGAPLMVPSMQQQQLIPMAGLSYAPQLQPMRHALVPPQPVPMGSHANCYSHLGGPSGLLAAGSTYGVTGTLVAANGGVGVGGAAGRSTLSTTYPGGLEQLGYYSSY